MDSFSIPLKKTNISHTRTCIIYKIWCPCAMQDRYCICVSIFSLRVAKYLHYSLIKGKFSLKEIMLGIKNKCELFFCFLFWGSKENESVYCMRCFIFLACLHNVYLVRLTLKIKDINWRQTCGDGHCLQRLTLSQVWGILFPKKCRYMHNVNIVFLL